MKTSIFCLALLAAVPAIASPIASTKTLNEKSAHVLVARAPRATTCGSFSYGTPAISNAFSNAIQASGSGTVVTAANGRRYPTTFNNYEAINLPDCSGISAPFLEFPVLRSGLPFQDGSDQGPDRVIYKQLTSGQYQFCGADTHEGAATANGVVACT